MLKQANVSVHTHEQFAHFKTCHQQQYMGAVDQGSINDYSVHYMKSICNRYTSMHMQSYSDVMYSRLAKILQQLFDKLLCWAPHKHSLICFLHEMRSKFLPCVTFQTGFPLCQKLRSFAPLPCYFILPEGNKTKEVRWRAAVYTEVMFSSSVTATHCYSFTISRKMQSWYQCF